MKLYELLIDQVLPESLQNINITGLSSDSRYANQGDLFFAKKGRESHGLDYIETLNAKNVACILYDTPYEKPFQTDIPHLLVDNLDEMIKRAAQKFYQNIRSLKLIGITGTEGKTTVNLFTAKILKALGVNAGTIGTNGIGTLEEYKENTHTTPDFLSLYKELSLLENKLSNQKEKIVILEVTSHALDQKRVEFLDFEVGTLTNLARDHLDYHKTLDAYKEAKTRLFTEYSLKNAVINSDDELGKELVQMVSQDQAITLYPYGRENHSHPNYLKIDQLLLKPSGISFNLIYKGQTIAIESPLFGDFNAYNLAAAIGNVLSLGFDFTEICQIIPMITNVKGRMEAYVLPNQSVAVVDYAHKPNALLQTLKSLKEHAPDSRLICVFGCGGDRDVGKRPLMAEIAEKNSDYIIVTNDNPRTENDIAIADDIISGFSLDFTNYAVILDRKEAILKALDLAKPLDIVLIAGKGHEDYQIVGQQKKHFSDSEVILAYSQSDDLSKSHE